MNDPSLDRRPEVIRCRSTADFLAALPQLTGFTAPDSIFVVFFSGRRAGRAMRVDLPASDRPSDSLGLLDLICDALHDLGSVQGVVSDPAVVISSGQTFAAAGGPPWRKLATRLERRLRREGIRLRELCCIAPDGWVSYRDPEAPPAGRPLSEIDESPIALEARLRGETRPPLSQLGAVPDPDPEKRAAVAAALEEIPPFESSGAAPSDFVARLAEHLRHPPPAGAYGWMTDTAEVVRALRDEDHPLEPSMTARLIRCAQHPDRWLLLALGILTRPEFPEELAREMGPAQFAGVPVDLDAGPAPSRRAGWSVRRILTSISPDFTGFERIPEIRRRLLAAVSEAPDELRAGLLALSAWVWWLGGTQSVAHRQALEAVALDPDSALARMAERMVSYPVYLPGPRSGTRAA